MAATGRFVLKICFALLITDVHSLRCYNKNETECSPSGPYCDVVAPPSENVPMTEMECGAGATMCAKVTFEGTGNNFIFKTQTAYCVVPKQVFGFPNAWYDNDDSVRIDLEAEKRLKQAEAQDGITFDAIERCFCDGDLCNGSIKSVFSISVIISSVVMSFMLFM